MFRILRLLFLALLVATSLTAWADFVRGVVRYSNGQPADHVIVRLRSDKLVYDSQTQTDIQGKFDFDGLAPTMYRLTIEGQGFIPYSNNIDLSMSHMANELITLRLVKEPESKAVPPEGPGAKLNTAGEVPEEAHKEFLKGQKLLDEKTDLDGSAKHFRKAIQVYDKYSEAYMMLGLVYLDEQKYEDSYAALQKSTELDPNAPGAYMALGTVLNQEKKYQEAEKALTRGLELKPDVAEGHYELSRTYWAMGRWQEAEPQAQKAVELQPNFAAAHVVLGNVALRKNDPGTALKEYKEYLRLDPKGPFANGVSQMIQKLEQSQKH